MPGPEVVGYKDKLVRSDGAIKFISKPNKDWTYGTKHF